MVYFEGRKGIAGESFNGKIIDIENPVDSVGNPFGAGYYTVLPISEWSFRKTNQTKAKCDIKKGTDTTIFVLTDDWGTIYEITVDNDDSAINKVYKYLKNEHLIPD